ncbi:DUF3307 domain-containing protein [Crassaminicella profunda]|uniref:DUF3307 domain-containing protein n=1 Tax=Crassaminicella profunda TaxID=1286698 RepID=UPI001CA727D6|nr:DUF3307 domain-containing protein [Crassaminicella profunda]QZY55758.1 DUF3307 domain-containing protein [Crassaminicella profunda]
MTVLLIAIFAHILADFVFQTDKIINDKRNMVKVAFLKHGFSVFMIVFIMLLLRYQFKVVLLYSMIISVSHIGIDYLNYSIQNKYNQLQEWMLFLIDQVIHVFIIFSGWTFFNFPQHDYITKFCSFLFKPKTIIVFNQISKTVAMENMQEGTILNKILIYGIVYLFFGVGGGYFISKILKDIENVTQSANDNEGLKKAGKIIGILERLLIITLVINNALSAIGFVIAAKSIARYDKITTKKEFAEYYLIGTFSSVLIGLIGGYMLMGMSRIFT